MMGSSLMKVHPTCRRNVLRTMSFVCSLVIVSFACAQAQTKTPGLVPDQEVFIENVGQYAPEVLYLGHAKGLSTWVTATSLVYDLQGTPYASGRKITRPSKFRAMNDEAQPELLTPHHVVRLEFEGAMALENSGTKAAPHHYNYFLASQDEIGTRTQQTERSSLKASGYHEVELRSLYPGIDLRMTYVRSNPRFDFIVKAGAKTELIRMKAFGAQSMYVDAAGSLHMSTGCGELVQGSLYAYQIIDGEQRAVSCRFRVHDQSIVFDLGSYDRNHDLVIDPTIYTTFVGGEDIDVVNAVERIGSNGNVIVVGYTQSASFPRTVGSYVSSNIGAEDVFVAQLNPQLSEYRYIAMVGGGSTDIAWGAAISKDGKSSVFVCGETSSANFPTTSGVVSQLQRGATDAFVFELNGTGDKLIYSTFHGGSGDDRAYSIVCDDAGNAYYCGETSSTNLSVKSGSYKTTAPGSGDGFVASLTPGAGLFNYATYLGGANKDRCTDIAFSGTSDVSMVVVGETKSTDFPLAPNTWGIPQCAQTKLNGTGVAVATDAFVTKLNPRGSDASYSTYLGANGDDYATAVSVDVVGVATVGGSTKSSNLSTIGEFQSSRRGIQDGFLCQVKQDGSVFTYASYFGGNNIDIINDLVTNNGYIYLTGYTHSNDFPTSADAVRQTTEEAQSGFVVKMRPNALVYGSYLGGKSSDQAQSICLVDDMHAYVGGQTTSPTLTVSDSAVQKSYGGTTDGFVSHVCFSNIVLASPQPAANYCAGSAMLITWTASQFAATDPFMVEFSPDNGAHWSTVKTQVTNRSYTWIIPASTASTSAARIRIVHEGSGFSADGSGVFSISAPPQILSISRDTALCPGKLLKLSVVASGDGLQYQWRKDGHVIGGATDAFLEFPSINPSDGAQYDVVINGQCGQAKISNLITCTVLRAPKITVGLSEQNVKLHGTAVLSVAATGTHLRYIWQRYKINLDVPDSSSLVIKDISLDDNARYRVIVVGDCGSDTSNEVYINVSIDQSVEPWIDAASIGLRIAPQPAYDWLTLKTGNPEVLSSLDPSSVHIENMLGVAYPHSLVTDGNIWRLSVRAYPVGIYALRIRTNKGVLCVPFVVSR